jgi:RNase H-fold protein (predicted Holliday junction resolvase)
MLLGIDPGTRKCGFAVVERLGAQPLDLGIASLDAFADRLASLLRTYPIEHVAIGCGTNAETIAAVVRTTGLPFDLVDERETTLRARARYFADHPPRGWRRLIPQGMLLPERPIDDYAALLIAERYLRLASAS